jgi:capsular polysaccharide export protein
MTLARKTPSQRPVHADGLLRARPVGGRRRLRVSAYEGDAHVEAVLAASGWETAELLERARKAVDQLVKGRVGGDCWTDDPGPDADLPTRHVLVFRSTLAMHDTVDAARNALPVVFATASATEATLADARRRGWRVAKRELSPWTLLDNAERLFTAGDEVGFLALLRGIPVHCFGPAIYAGWGLTVDAGIEPRRTLRKLEELFAAHCLLATRYHDPHGTGGAATFEAVCDFLSHWRRRDEANRRIKACVGMSHWKRKRMAEFLDSSSGPPRFLQRASEAVKLARDGGGSIAVWGPREPQGLREAAAAANVPLIQIEDGFLRSVGLGSDFTPAASIVVDARGIYYDPSRPSDLEHILNETIFDAGLLQRAAKLTELVVVAGITKYNTGKPAPSLAHAGDRRRIFVPGQVEDDRSVQLGGCEVKTNLDLLQRVRLANPDAFIVYKPHPDVDAGHRGGAVPAAAARNFADQVVRGVSSAELIAATDEVHTMTSLAGFEALLRRRRVVVYGRPFYAGWGLTHDLSEQWRRQRRLTLEELVAGVLILYPRYMDPVSRLPCTPEQLIDRLADRQLWSAGVLTRLRQLQGIIMRGARHGTARWRLRPS